MNYQFTSRQLTLDLSRSNQGHMTSKGLHLVNGASSYQILHETHTCSKSYMVFQFTPFRHVVKYIEKYLNTNTNTFHKIKYKYKYKYSQMQMYLNTNTNTFKSISNTNTNTFHVFISFLV